MNLDITIGWSDNGFRLWQPGDKQHIEEVQVCIFDPVDPEAIAEMVFYATNVPAHVVASTDIPNQILEALFARGFNGSQSGHFSLSVGDTVTVGEVMLGCDSFGWKRVYPSVEVGA